MKIKFKPAKRLLFSPFDGLDLGALAEARAAAKAAQKCDRGSKRNAKTGKCEPRSRKAKV